MLNMSGANTKPKENGDGRKTMERMMIDSIIIGGIAMIAAAPSGVPDITSCWVMLKAFLGSFLFQLAVERGLKRPKSS